VSHYRIRVYNYAGTEEIFVYISSVVPRMDDIIYREKKEYKVERVKYCIEINEHFDSCQEAIVYTVELT
jgi:hypothetical protein